MGYIDYTREPRSDIAFIDMKSFYASVECVERGLHPLRTSLCVLSRSDITSGVILASSPIFKQVFGKSNVSRTYDLPFDIRTRKFSYTNARKQGLPTSPDFVRYIESWAKRTYIVPPRMNLYIQKNVEIQSIFLDYVSPEEVLPYSIDEGFLDLTSSLNYFVKDKSLTRREKLDLVCDRIQHAIWRKTGIYSTIGMSNANPLLAKLALDIEAKKTLTMRANWSYEDVEEKVWGIQELTDFWGIGYRTAKRLNRLGIGNVKQLANSNPDTLKKEFGVMGVQLWFHANGVDESNLSNPYKPQSTGIGNSQILPRDYTVQTEIELVIREMAEQVAIRLRRARKKAGNVSLHISYSKTEGLESLQGQMQVDPTNQTRILSHHLIQLFRAKYEGGAVRRIGVRYSQLVDESYSLISLFDDTEALEKEERLQSTMDHLRKDHGFLSIMKASALSSGSRLIARSKLTGGHSAGGLDGLE
ncbi:Y-family DNA polymerase [Streptococcus cameli]